MFNKVLILSQNKYSLTEEFRNIFDEISKEVTVIDNSQVVSKNDRIISTQIFRLPYSIRTKWEAYFLNKINDFYLDIISKGEYDLLLVYNSQYLLPSTCEYIKKNGIKLVFFMGDSPFYTHTNNNYLSILAYGDLILSPDTFWIQQLNILGIKNIHYFIIGIDSNHYYKVEDSELSKYSDIEDNNILYVGLNYVNSWGAKKALFLNSFVSSGLKIYGSKHWKKWFDLYPDLERVYTEVGYIPVKQLNIMLNKTKIVPVDNNPGLLNGFHIRLLEALGSGALPISEYKHDINNVFLKGSDVKLPVIDNINKSSNIASYFVKNNNERNQIVSGVTDFVLQNYSTKKNAERILEFLDNEK